MSLGFNYKLPSKNDLDFRKQNKTNGNKMFFDLNASNHELMQIYWIRLTKATFCLVLHSYLKWNNTEVKENYNNPLSLTMRFKAQFVYNIACR